MNYYLLLIHTGSKVRLVTLELAILMLKTLVFKAGERSFLQDGHLAAVEGIREEATLQMRNFYKVWEKVMAIVCFVYRLLYIIIIRL
jgi:hypothetical protein